MARNTRIAVPANTPTQLTNADVASVSFFNLGGSFILIQGSVGAVEPTTWGPYYRQGRGELKLVLADLFLGISGVNRLWAYSSTATTVWVSHG